VTSKNSLPLLAGELLEEEVEFTLAELCSACGVPAERVLELVQEGIAEPVGGEYGNWRFRGVSIRRVHRAVRLERDLGVNVAGVALALDLLEELERLQRRLDRLEG